MPKCDYCSSPNPVVIYPAEQFDYIIVDDDIIQRSLEGWSACAECKALIDAGDLDAVIDRSLSAHLRIYPDLSEHSAELRQMIATLHRETFKRMTGQPMPISPTLDPVEAV